MTPTSDDIIERFSTLLLFGSKKMSSVELNLDTTRIKKQVLYFIMCSAQSYSEGILKLIKPPNIYNLAAESIFRSLLEQYINIHLIYSAKSNKYAHLFLIQFLSNKVKFSNKNIALFTKYPDWKIDFGEIKNIKGWEKFRNKWASQALRYKKRFKIPIGENYPNIENCCRLYDREMKSKGKFKRLLSLEDFYVKYYDYFSQSAHLNMSGLNKFFKQHNNGKMSLVVDGNEEDLIRTLVISYQFYFFILMTTLKKFGAYKRSDVDEFVEYSKSLLN
jgi:hypothetical protein